MIFYNLPTLSHSPAPYNSELIVLLSMSITYSRDRVYKAAYILLHVLSDQAWMGSLDGISKSTILEEAMLRSNLVTYSMALRITKTGRDYGRS